MKINFNEDQNGHKYVCVNIDLEVLIKKQIISSRMLVRVQ